MRIVYFARVREVIGEDAQDLDIPSSVITIADVLDWLSAQGHPYDDAFADTAKLRFAIDQHMAKIDAPLNGAKELAIFPPVTGG